RGLRRPAPARLRGPRPRPGARVPDLRRDDHHARRLHPGPPGLPHRGLPRADRRRRPRQQPRPRTPRPPDGRQRPLVARSRARLAGSAAEKSDARCVTGRYPPRRSRRGSVVGHVEVAHLTYVLPDGRPLLNDVSFRIGEGVKAALVGPNGAGKTTLMRLIAGDLQPVEGNAVSSGGLGVMRQFIGNVRGGSNVHDLLLSVAPPAVRQAAGRLEQAELAMMERDDEKTQLRYAQAISDYTDAGGYEIEVLWDTCTVAALGVPYDRIKYRDVAKLSGG